MQKSIVVDQMLKIALRGGGKMVIPTEKKKNSTTSQILKPPQILPSSLLQEGAVKDSRRHAAADLLGLAQSNPKEPSAAAADQHKSRRRRKAKSDIVNVLDREEKNGEGKKEGRIVNSAPDQAVNRRQKSKSLGAEPLPINHRPTRRRPVAIPTSKRNTLVSETHGITTAKQAYQREHREKFSYASTFSWADDRSVESISTTKETKSQTNSPATQSTSVSHSETLRRNKSSAPTATTAGSSGAGCSKQQIKPPKKLSKKPPSQKLSRPPQIISKKTVLVQKKLESIYASSRFKEQRQKRVVEQLEALILEKAIRHNQEVEDDQQKYRKDRSKQLKSLKKVRDKFDQQQIQRFKTQYVTWKSVENERKNRRSSYGLPEDETDVSHLVKINRQPKRKVTFQEAAKKIRNIKRFEKILNPKLYSNAEIFKVPDKLMVEGIDTVFLETGKLKDKKKMTQVRDVIHSAKRVMSEEMDAISEVSDLQDVVSDDPDMFSESTTELDQ